MKRALILFAAVWVMSGLIAGCSDETECQLCPTPENAPELFAIGTAVYDPPWELTVVIDVYNTAGSRRRVEAALADNYPLCVSDVPHSAAEDGHQQVRSWGGEYCPSELIIGFTATDTTTFTFDCDGKLHRTELHLLDPDDSAPRHLTVSADSLLGTLDVEWDPVAGAEWYSLKIRTRINFAMAWNWEFYSSDTTAVTVPLSMPYERTQDVRVYVAACTGPRPDAAGPEHNISGPYMSGSIYSVSNDAYYYLEVTPLAGAAATERSAWIEPPSLLEIIRVE